MELYKIIQLLTKEEFEEIYQSFLQKNAEKSALFFKIIRECPEDPEKLFLSQCDITPGAFYVLKSRLNQKIETYLLGRIGEPQLQVMRQLMNVDDLMFNNPKEIAQAALNHLEKELTRYDHPYGLMMVYKELQNLNIFQAEKYDYYKARYNQQVAYAVALNQGMDLIVQFFEAFDRYHRKRSERAQRDMVRFAEKIFHLSNLYESHRLFIYKAIIHLFAKFYIEIPALLQQDMEDTDTLFEKSFEIIDAYKEDNFYKNIGLVFNFLRYLYYEQQNVTNKARIFFDILENKIDKLVGSYHYHVGTSMFLEKKVLYHVRTNTLDQLRIDAERWLGKVQVEPENLTSYVNFYMFVAKAYFLNQKYNECRKILFQLDNLVNLRKSPHMNLEVKLLLAVCYAKLRDYELADQLILSLQRQLRKPEMVNYDHARDLLKMLVIYLGGSERNRTRQFNTCLEHWNQANVGKFVLLSGLDFQTLLGVELYRMVAA